MFELNRGVVAVDYEIGSAAEAATRATSLAQTALAAGTFGVGGFLMTRSGRVIAEAVNAVIRDGRVADPTAHVERQLIDWYFQSRRDGLESAQVSPAELVIVSSLDPCAMCAGAIVSAGCNAVALAQDSLSGIHDAEGHPHRMPAELWPQAERSLGLFSLPGRISRNRPICEILSAPVEDHVLQLSERSFRSSLDAIRGLVASIDPSAAPASTQDIARLQQIGDGLPDTAGLPSSLLDTKDDRSLDELRSILAEDASALIDPDGIVLLSASGRESLSPARSSVLELVRAYVYLRHAASDRLGIALPHQRRCSILKLRPTDSPAKALLELGAIGSFFEEAHVGEVPALTYLDFDDGALVERTLRSLPPLYNTVIGINVGGMAVPA